MKETLGRRLRRLREQRGLSQRDLSEPGVTYAYISRLESDDRCASTKALRRLAPKLGVSVHYLEFGVEDPNEESLLKAAVIIRALLAERRALRRRVRALEAAQGQALARDLADSARKSRDRSADAC